MLPEGHTDGVTVFSYSPDSRYLVTATNGFEDRTVRMWEIKTGKLLYTMRGHLVPVSNALFSPDGKYILTHAYFNHLWNAATGELISMADSAVSNVTCFTPDSRYLVMARVKNDEIVFWNIETQKKERSIFCDGNIYSQLEITKDGRYLVGYSAEKDSSTESGNIAVWEVGSGKKVFSKDCGVSEKAVIKTSPRNTKAFVATRNERYLINLENKTVLDTNYNTFYPDARKCAFSDDDKFLYLAERESLYQLSTEDFQYKYQLVKDDAGIAAITILPEKKELIALNTSGDFYVYGIGDTLKSVGTYETPYGRTNNLQASPDGKTFTISTFNRYTIIISYPAFKLSSYLTGEAASMYKLTATARRDKLAISSITGEVRIADPRTGKVNRTITDSSGNINEIFFSPDGKRLTGSIGGDQKGMAGWDAETGKRIYKVTEKEALFFKSVYNPDGKTLATWDGNKQVLTIKDANTGKNINRHELTDKAYYGTVLMYSRDGKQLYINRNAEMQVRDGSTGKLITTLNGPDRVTQHIISMDISPDNKSICAATENLFWAWELASGKRFIHHYWTDDPEKAKEEKFISISFSPGGNQLILPNENGQTLVMDYVIDSVKHLLNNHYPATLKDAVFSPNGKYFVTIGGKLGYMLSHDAVTGEILARFGDQSEEIHGYTFSEDGNEIIAIAENVMSKYNIVTGKRLYRTLFINDNDWLTIDEEGRFDGTEAARKLLYFTCGKEIVELEQVKDKLWVPGLAEKINRGDSITAATVNDLNICGLTPLVQQKGEENNAYQFGVIARKGGLGDVILQVNGIEVRRYRPAELTRTDSLYELKVSKEELEPYFASGHSNKVTLRALTRNNDITSRSLIVDEDSVKTSTAPPRLFAVIVGVSDYKGDDLDLKYAAKDATDIAAAINTAARKLLNTDTSNRVFIYNYNSNETVRQQPEKNNVKKAFEDISKKAMANDILMVFFAGHGVMEGERKQFYFLTAEASKISATEDVAAVGISTAELAEWMKPENIKAQKRVLIFDACNSGQAIKDFVRMGNSGQGYVAARNDEKEQIIKAIDKLNEKSGLFILSASASNQSAYEMGRYTQGLLTHALLKVMKEQNDILEDGKFLNLSRWLNAAEKVVTELSKENGARQEPQIVSNTNFNIGVVDAEVRSKIILPKEKPLFTFSNFQNSSEVIADDDLDLSRVINQQLNDISSRSSGSQLIYAFGATDTDAHALTGRYAVKAGQVTVKVNIKKGGKVIHRFEVNGKSNQLKELAAAIIQKAAEKIQ